jgi:hypothetical protein
MPFMRVFDLGLPTAVEMFLFIMSLLIPALGLMFAMDALQHSLATKGFVVTLHRLLVAALRDAAFVILAYYVIIRLKPDIDQPLLVAIATRALVTIALLKPNRLLATSAFVNALAESQSTDKHMAVIQTSNVSSTSIGQGRDIAEQ